MIVGSRPLVLLRLTVAFWKAVQEALRYLVWRQIGIAISANIASFAPRVRTVRMLGGRWAATTCNHDFSFANTLLKAVKAFLKVRSEIAIGTCRAVP
jgi:hypothetical protein